MSRAAKAVAAGLLAGAILAPGPAQARSPANCAPDDRPEPALQGQVPVSERLSGVAEAGYWCNLMLVGEFESHGNGNFDTYRNCAYYSDNEGANTATGTVVLDVSDPARPVKTDYLKSRAMRSAGESLRVNQARGLLVANRYSPVGSGTPDFYHALGVYDVSSDCRRPRLLADVLMPSAVGHEGCFQPDGMVYYMASVRTITPIDLTDPRRPRQLSEPWSLRVHGCSISDDGRRGYFATVLGAEMLVVDTSQAQARTPGAEPRVLGRFPTPDAEVQQATSPLYYGDRPHVLLWSEGTLPPKTCIPGKSNFGYSWILDVSDETRPTEVSKIQTEVVQSQNCERVAADATLETSGVEKGDPQSLVLSWVFGYDTHMCTPDRLHDPTIAACAQLGSGLRVYDIRDARNPVEIAYYNTGTKKGGDPTLDWALARPVIRRDLRQIWWVTWSEGFHVVKFREGCGPSQAMSAVPARTTTSGPSTTSATSSAGEPARRRPRRRARGAALSCSVCRGQSSAARAVSASTSTAGACGSCGGGARACTSICGMRGPAGIGSRS